MENRRFKPMLDKLYLILLIPTAVVMGAMTVLSAFEPISLLITLPIDIITFYFLISPLFGYVELRENTLFIKFGFILKREIPYDKIRGLVKDRNKFDMVSVSVVTNDNFIKELEARVSGKSA